MIDLTDLAGYPLKFDEESCGLSLDAHLRQPGYSTRELDALRPVLLDPDCDGPEVIYWMYRDICRPEDAALGEAHGLRYDLSAFRSVMLGREYMKTSGHYHPPIPGTRAAYPEVYEVLYGEALYVMQRVADYCAAATETTVEDVIVARVCAGQKIVMPPGYGHVTINTLDRPLLMSNWVSNRFASFYGSVEERAASPGTWSRMRANRAGSPTSATAAACPSSASPRCAKCLSWGSPGTCPCTGHVRRRRRSSPSSTSRRASSASSGRTWSSPEHGSGRA